MPICISSGHGLHIRGASKYLDEVDEARKVVDEVGRLLKEAGQQIYTFHDNTSTTQDQNLHTIVAWHNGKVRHLDVSCHFNAFDDDGTSKPMGCEVWYYSKADLAAKVSKGMATALALPDRGEKYSGSLYFLSNTNEPAILLECCFVDSTADAEHYEAQFDALCKSLAETISGVSIGEPSEPPPETIEPPPEPEVPVVEITVKAKGNVKVIINGQEIEIEVNGIPANQRQVITTVFGGVADQEYSSYAPYDSQGRGPFLDDSSLYVALPWKFQGDRPKVRVYNRENGTSSVGEIWDVGPWFTTNDYFNTGLRSLSEICYLNGVPCPHGPNEGTVPNGAGIDVSPAMAKALGFSGKALVDWEFV